jgi:hypothetical protein
MNEPMILFTFAASGLAGLGMATAAGLKGWQGWLAVRRLELSRGRELGEQAFPAARPEIADLKARVRKLEAIAAGIDV